MLLLLYGLIQSKYSIFLVVMYSNFAIALVCADWYPCCYGHIPWSLEAKCNCVNGEWTVAEFDHRCFRKGGKWMLMFSSASDFIWPLCDPHSLQIKLALLNARVSSTSFKRWSGPVLLPLISLMLSKFSLIAPLVCAAIHCIVVICVFCCYLL